MDKAEEKDDLKIPPIVASALKKCIDDIEDPIRYVVYSQLLPASDFRLFLDVRNSFYASDLQDASLFKDFLAARAVAEVYSRNRSGTLLIAKVSIAGSQVEIVSYDDEHSGQGCFDISQRDFFDCMSGIDLKQPSGEED